jgi:putative membrane protein
MIVSFGIWFIFLAVAIHIYIWILESFLWTKPKTTKIFGISHKDAVVSKQLAFNQGFYNLFIAIIAFAGAVRLLMVHDTIGFVLVAAGAGTMILAGLVLLMSKGKTLRPALVQFVSALIGIILIALG